jgi:inhibitor of cysteine peptidase
MLIGVNGMSNIRSGITVLMIYLILAAVPTAVCATPNKEGYTKIITENDDGKTIHIKKGESFCLRLKENPSTGYSWQLSLSKGLSLLNTEYRPPDSSKSSQRLVVGAAGLHSWKIKAIAKGSQQVKGIYRRSWETETGSEQTFKLDVKVI